jgi:cob(I)alamin adenosyltransferase
MIIVNTGNGKGKTTAAVGQIIRSLGRGWKVCLIQLFKGKEFYGEQKILKGLKGLDFYCFAPKHPGCFPGVYRASLVSDCGKALEQFEKALNSKKKYDLIVLEEFNIALRDSFLKAEPLLELLKHKPSNVNVFITGRSAPKALLELADIVTEMKEVKHHYHNGVLAKKGIEF